MFSNEQLAKILLARKIIADQNALAEITQKAGTEKEALEKYVIDNKIVSEQTLYEGAADYFKIPFVNLEKLEFIRKKTNLEPEVHLATPSSIEDTLKQYRKDIKSQLKVIEEDSEEKEKKGKKETEAGSELPIIKIIDTLLEQAFYENASDIHIEPAEKETSIRYRIDCILANVMTLPKNAHPALIARVKVLANLKVDEHRLPQDGRFKIIQKGNKISFRVSILPTLYGEKIVMRLLEEKPQVLSLEQIGFQPKSLELVKKNIKKPHGMILVTGPTGSGKTTTL